MKINDKIHGFAVTDVTDIPALDARLCLLQHIKTGAGLCYLRRPDESRTFAITFGTPPTDDTGVFHILEHSVLCGSEKFPTKEPFTELLKGSLNTFLNAMTYSDRTSYPVASRNDRDFYNLVDVYLDAVFNPMATREERIFRQEGWRYEVDEAGEVSYNGVVYSEMKGDYSSPDSLAGYHIERLLFPGGTYSHDSGGNPDAIPTLTYADFCAAHARYYHPSGAYIFLDGEPDIDRILPLINSYLSRYEERPTDFTVDEGGEVITEPLYESYEIDDGETAENKGRLYLAWRALGWGDYADKTLLSITAAALSDTNTSPLKSRILRSGLCSNMYFYPSFGTKWGTLNAEFRDVKDGCERELIELFDTALAEIISRGIDKNLLYATCDQTEFRLREADFGSSPRGIAYLSAINDIWLYGGHPKDALASDAVISAVRDMIRDGDAEQLLKTVLSGRRAELHLTPKRGLAREREIKEKEALDRALSLLDPEVRAALSDSSSAFTEWQSREDTPEALATIPRLSLADISADVREVQTTIDNYEGTKLLLHDIAANGITYAELAFDATDFTPDEIAALVILSRLMKNLDGETMSAEEREMRAKSTLGAIRFLPTVVVNGGEPKLYFSIQYSALDTKRDAALTLILEYILRAIIDNEAEISRTLTQAAAIHEDLLIESGHSVALLRSLAKCEPSHAVREFASGFELYRRIRAERDKEDKSELIQRLSDVAARLIVRERLTVAVGGRDTLSYARDIASKIPTGGRPAGKSKIKTLPHKSEGIVIPSRVSYASFGTSLYFADKYAPTGAWSTLSSLVDFEILWEEVRVKGGAYGTGFLARTNSGGSAFYSYRDPDPARTLGVYETVPSRIRERVASGINLEQLIIGTVGSLDPVSTPAQDASSATALHLAGKTHADLVRARRECIEATEDTLLSLADILEDALRGGVATVVGPRETLLTLGLDEILEP